VIPEPPPSCDFSQGQTPCGNNCCDAGQFCENVSLGTCKSVSTCQNPCGFEGQLCCEPGDICVVDANNQAQCISGTTEPPPTCPVETTIYTTVSSYQSTIFETITLVLSHVEIGVETIYRTAIVQRSPQACFSELGQSQCGDACCRSDQFCQAGNCVSQSCASPGTTLSGSPPIRPTSTTTVPFEVPVSTG
jgi:hypothetical protein